MTQRGVILEAIYRAVASTNDLIPEPKRLKSNESEVIMGGAGEIDSLGLVNLLVTIESEVKLSCGRCPDLTAVFFDLDLGELTLGQLANYIVEQAD